MKVKECCCGCTLRTGSLIILWIFLIGHAIFISSYASWLHNLKDDNQYYWMQVAYSVYELISDIFGFICCLVGIYAIQKNKAKFLLPFYYYLLYIIGFFAISILFFVFVPTAYLNVTTANGHPQITFELVVTLILASIFVAALYSYFAVVIHSYHHVMLTNNGGAGFPAQDPVAVGYHNSV